jgi:TonB family protein
LWISNTTFEAPPAYQPERVFTPLVTHLYTPRDITQKAPNKGELSKELSVEAIAPRPMVKAPAPARRFAPPPPAQRAQNNPKPQVAEPPKIQGPATPDQSNQLALGQLPSAPAPADSPKLTLEDAGRSPNPGKPAGTFQLPSSNVQDAIRNLTRGTAAGAQSVGDIGADESGSGPGLNLPPSAGRPRSSLELRSDPMGVDFRPYMVQILAAIRRNWFAVYPEAARLGMRGEVSLMFGIAKQGGVTKIVFISETSSKPLNEAAVAAISASNPLPPLPPQFKGDRIVLQMKFLYNMPR